MDDIFDESALLRTVQGDRALFNELGALFFDEVPAQLEVLREAIANHDAPALRFAAHALKGSASTLTARQVAAAAFALEERAATENFDGADSCLRELESAIVALRARFGVGSG